MGLLKIKRKGEPKPAVDTALEQAEVMPPDQLGISDAASVRISELMREKSVPCYLRVAIRGGGCSGLSIHYEWAQELKSNDTVFSKGDAQVVIDKKSLGILGGATLHCRNYLGSVEFMLLNNPAAKQCSCGQSFSL